MFFTILDLQFVKQLLVALATTRVIKCTLFQVIIVVVLLSKLRQMYDFVEEITINYTNTQRVLPNRKILILCALTLFSYQGVFSCSISITSEKRCLYVLLVITPLPNKQFTNLHTNCLSNFAY